jgi:cell division protease FtsH
MNRAERILNENVEQLHRLSAALLDREILDSEEIDKVIRGEILPPVEKNNGDENDHPIEDKELDEAVKVIKAARDGKK